MGNLFTMFISSYECQLILKLILILILSGFIGLQRTSWNKPAGFKTHVLVGISAVLVMECGMYLYHTYSNVDPTRIAAQLLSGIGFLGAGTILRDGFSVKGLTTAASLLAVTCIGLVIGAGFYIGGMVATLIVYLVLSSSKSISERVGHFDEINLQINVNDPKKKIEKIQEFLTNNDIEITEIRIFDNDDDKEYIKISGQYREKIDKNKIISGLMKIEEVKHVLEI